VPPLLLLALVLYRLTPSAFVAEFAGELTYRRGGCGVVIFSIGLLESGLLLFLARRGAPTRLGLTAAWIAVAAGGLGLFVTQFFVCYLSNNSRDKKSKVLGAPYVVLKNQVFVNLSIFM
jgi:hypothetical protein